MNWQSVTLISRQSVSKDVYSLVFKMDNWQKHFPGQHYDIRLTAENGYQAQRSYSIASSPNQENIIEFGIQLLDDGEVSPYLVNQLQLGEKIEVKGPLGGYFFWDINIPGDLLLIAGGSGVIPFISMLRYFKENIGYTPSKSIVLLLSAQDLEHIPYYEELKHLLVNIPEINIVITLTKQSPISWKGYQRRIDKEMLRDVFSFYIDKMPMIFICGTTPFVEKAANILVDLGFQSHFIKTERFGG